MQRIFYPNSVVVIGVSERPENLARTIVVNLCAFGYKGRLFAVGRKEGSVEGIPITASLDQVPYGIDLAVILTPAGTVPDLLDACGRKGIKHAVIESGGFSDWHNSHRSRRGYDNNHRRGDIAVKCGCITDECDQSDSNMVDNEWDRSGSH